jgi:hypothetical protein
MQLTFTIPDSAAELLTRLMLCIRENSHHAPSIHEIARSIVLDVLIDDAQQHGLVVDISQICPPRLN